ncbi:hypothetical protein EYF80_017160 [Liparis tanakae]|uniref:Uncharacterized protein n=1 Tax=Liparis tanakae TaxID=230148 RepID=A0A4Z2I5P6_9TELE|nr:hypothetical protein EYF80_017160 [Liparis tanakae]
MVNHLQFATLTPSPSPQNKSSITTSSSTTCRVRGVRGSTSEAVCLTGTYSTLWSRVKVSVGVLKHLERVNLLWIQEVIRTALERKHCAVWRTTKKDSCNWKCAHVLFTVCRRSLCCSLWVVCCLFAT